MHARSFTPFERMIALADEQHPFNAVVLLRLKPAPDPARIRSALDDIQQRYPMLQARISPADGGFRFDADRPIPFETATGSPDDGWLPLAERRLNTRLDTRQGPLLLVELLAASDRSTAALCFTFHHSIMDASSVTHLLQDFFKRLDGKEPAPALPLMPDIEKRFPTSFRSFRRPFAMLGFMARQGLDELTFRLDALRHPPLSLQPVGACRLTWLELTLDETQQVVRSARAAGVTLNSYLNAALALTCNRVVYGGEARLLRMIAFADLRPYLDPPLPTGALGNAISMIQVTEKYKTGMGLKKFARQIHPALLEGFRRGDKFAAFLMADKLVRMVVGLNRIRLATTALSYTGPADLPETAGDVRITDIHAAIANNRFGPVLSGQARLFRERLGIDILYIDSDMSPEQAAEVRATLHGVLTQSG